MITALKIAGLMCLIYYVLIILYTRLVISFSVFWLLAGAAFLSLGQTLYYLDSRAPVLAQTVRLILTCLLAAAIIIFVYIEILIIAAGFKRESKARDYAIILGAQVRGRRPTKAMRRRVNGALTYLKQHPGARVIPSGGKGKGEYISEAHCMAEMLIEAGIAPERIIRESESNNTDENIRNSLKIAGKCNGVVIVTCPFHLYRALKIAGKQADKSILISGYPSRTDPFLMTNFYVREFFAVIQYKLKGRI